ncbi:MAG: T9SS type A sorting domain-containing protein [Chitinophagales bacterium]
MQSNITIRLAEYAAFAASVLVIANKAEAEVIYTDIDPDIVLDSNGEGALVDMDNDGINDFGFLKSSALYTYYTYFSSFPEIRFRNYIWAGPSIDGNKIGGDILFHSWSGTYWYLCDCFGYSAVINSNNNFYSNGNQIMAGLISLQLQTGGFTSWSKYGYWFGKPDRYLGVYFADSDHNYHYGWIRCSVSDSADVLTIKDYAYNAEPETGLLAGTLISGIPASGNTLKAEVYSFAQNVYINIENVQDVTVSILNMQGESVLIKNINSSNEVIDMSYFSPGVYLISVQQDNKAYVKKVVIE